MKKRSRCRICAAAGQQRSGDAALLGTHKEHSVLVRQRQDLAAVLRQVCLQKRHDAEVHAWLANDDL